MEVIAVATTSQSNSSCPRNYNLPPSMPKTRSPPAKARIEVTAADARKRRPVTKAIAVAIDNAGKKGRQKPKQ